MVECHYEGAVLYVPRKVFMEILLRTRIDEKKFVRYKEGAQI